jgi:hypothetical protein
MNTWRPLARSSSPPGATTSFKLAALGFSSNKSTSTRFGAASGNGLSRSNSRSSRALRTRTWHGLPSCLASAASSSFFTLASARDERNTTLPD